MVWLVDEERAGSVLRWMLFIFLVLLILSWIFAPELGLARENSRQATVRISENFYKEFTEKRATLEFLMDNDGCKKFRFFALLPRPEAQDVTLIINCESWK